MKKTVIFGGTFNPPQIAHEQMLKYLNAREDISRILIVPTKNPVHKAFLDMAPESCRLEMCEILAEEFSKAEVWDTELKRAEKSYTYYTLLEYKRLYGDIPYFLCGADMLVTISTWYKYKELLKLCRFLAFYREGESSEEFSLAAEKIKADGGSIEILPQKINGISSTNVRNAVSSCQPLNDTVSEKIEKYIKDNNLYKDAKDMTVSEYKAHIRARLTDKRYFHSLCVAEEAVRLADRYGADKEMAYVAGLLHDVLKDTKPETQLKFAKDFGIILTDVELGAPKLYHSIIGSAYIKNVLGVTDSEIINAVRYHTTAKKDMSPLETVLYLADYTSRDRDYDGVENMRKAVEVSLGEAMKIALIFTVGELKEKGVPIHPDTLAAYKQYVG